MKLAVIYRPSDEGSLAVEQYVREFLRQRPDRSLELVNADTPEGTRLGELYGLTVYPAILATADNGSLIRLWQDKQLPSYSELSGISS